MSQKLDQHQSKCYCNSVGSTCCNGCIKCLKCRATGSGSIFSVASKNNKQKQNFNKKTTEKYKQKTDFVKINRKAVKTIDAGKNRHGLGHSQAAQTTTAAANFSRRNSTATTVTFSTPPSVTPTEDLMRNSNATTPTSTKTPSPLPPQPQPPTTILKMKPATMASLGENFRALSVSAKGELGSDFGGILQPEYTEQRRSYESVKQLMKLISTQSDNFTSLNIASGGGGGGSGCVGCAADGFGDTYSEDAAVDVHRLHTLQQFRLQNADDCFSVHRQLDLKLPMRQTCAKQPADQQQIRNLLNTLLERESGQPKQQPTLKQNKTIERNEKSAKKAPTTSLTPYAVRQKLLQLRMEADEIGHMKPGRKLYGAMGNSFALRYQEI